MRVSEIDEWPGQFGNWNRWPNFAGTLNLVTPELVRQAARLIRTGQVFACAAPLRPVQYAPEFSELLNVAGPGYEHQMLRARELEEGRFSAADRISVNVHSLQNTHLDALSHVGHDGRGFNGIGVDDMATLEDGAKIGAITEIPAIVTRGVLVDVPRLRGIDHLRPGEWVTLEDLEEGAANAGPGDALLVRTGRWRAPVVLPGDPGASGDLHGDWAGLHADCMGFVAEHDLATVATDSTTDTFPLPTPRLPTIHALAEVYLGLPLMHSLDLEALAEACADQGRGEFFFAVAPLRIEGGTGSPVTPIAIL